MPADDNQTKSNEFPFRPRARILQLLGDELIGSPRLAVFELVKNAYDADASRVDVYLNGLETGSPAIVVQDDGNGMDLETIRDIWLVPAHGHRGEQRATHVRTKKKNRLPLGEKGLGRFAVHKLGEKIKMVTRAEGQMECVVSIDWSEIIEKEFLSEALVRIEEREPKLFMGDKTGTRIAISNLKGQDWTRGEARRLLRQITSIASPFALGSNDFVAELHVPGNTDWLKNVPDMEGVLARAPWHFKFVLADGVYRWEYKFRGVPGLKIEPRELSVDDRPLQISRRTQYDDFGIPISGPTGQKKVIASKETSEGIGPVRGEFFVFDRDKDVVGRIGDGRLVQSILDEQGGVRIYRDGIRVYNYGEPGDDWLGLDLRRVNSPTRNISRNIMLGYIDLDLEHSDGLVEKTNREGFVESDAFNRLRAVVLGALATLEIERKIDKDRLRAVTAKSPDGQMESIVKPIAELRAGLRKHHLEKELGPYLDRIERDYDEMKDSMLRSGLSGMSLAIVFHEVERGVRVLHDSLRAGAESQLLEVQARELVRVLDGFSELLRKGEKKRNSLKRLVREARDLNAVRLRAHRIRLVCPFLEESVADVEAIFAFGLVLGALNNLIDNAIYWMQVRWPDDDKSSSKSARAIYLNISSDLGTGPSLVISDTGPGFQDTPEDMVKPFFTRRPEGMGLGLYYANLVMQLNDGDLVFPSADDAEAPEEFDGALLALTFKGAE